MKADWHTCLPIPCPLCGKIVSYILFEEVDSMCTLFCGCRITQEEWGNVYRLPLPLGIPPRVEPTDCPWCKTSHVPGKGCAA